MKRLRDKLIADLTETRPLSEQVVRTLMDRCELRSDEVGPFLSEQVPKEDDAVLDTALSPMYTPQLADRARYVEDRERLTITPAVLGVIIEDLAAANLTASYLYEEDTIHMPLPEVVIDRWVRLLHLEVRLPERVAQAVEATVPAECLAEAKALCGHTAWRGEGREDILLAFLTGFARTGHFLVDKFEYLTGLVHTYRPTDVRHFSQQLEALIKSYHEESNEHFFDAHLKEAYGHGGGTTNPVKDSYGNVRKRQMALATQLQGDLAEFFATVSP
ncbi:MAG: hypothetical protein OEY97_10530 [Nitrospirota bacterium]|nr:hypothetical protein [Nitrospirota bacterium]